MPIPKLIEATKESFKMIKQTPPATKTIPSNKNLKQTITHTEKKKTCSLIKPVQPINKLPPKNNTPKPEAQSLLNKPLVLTMKKPESKLIINTNKATKEPVNDLSKTVLKLKRNTCMYDRIKERARHEQIRNEYAKFQI